MGMTIRPKKRAPKSYPKPNLVSWQESTYSAPILRKHDFGKCTLVEDSKHRWGLDPHNFNDYWFVPALAIIQFTVLSLSMLKLMY